MKTFADFLREKYGEMDINTLKEIRLDRLQLHTICHLKTFEIFEKKLLNR